MVEAPRVCRRPHTLGDWPSPDHRRRLAHASGPVDLIRVVPMGVDRENLVGAASRPISETVPGCSASRRGSNEHVQTAHSGPTDTPSRRRRQREPRRTGPPGSAALRGACFPPRRVKRPACSRDEAHRGSGGRPAEQSYRRQRDPEHSRVHSPGSHGSLGAAWPHCPTPTAPPSPSPARP